MTDPLARVLEQALELPKHDRLTLAATLWASVEEDPVLTKCKPHGWKSSGDASSGSSRARIQGFPGKRSESDSP